MKLHLFSCFYNEAFLIPFFLSHYHYVDTISACVTPSSDETRELLAADPRVVISDVEMSTGIDDEVKVTWLNDSIGRHGDDDDWYIVADADEFVFPPGDPTGETARAYLATVPASDAALMAKMAHVYRSAQDVDLDVTARPIVLQRRCGQEHLVKPIIIRPNRGVALAPGNHAFRSEHRASETHAFQGAHWANADPAFTITRRVRDRGARISPTNRMRGHGSHHWDVTVEQVKADLERHVDDGPLF